MTDLVLVSHHLCPYVQRAAIALMEKDVPFERRDIDLADKPDWFRAISPLGRTPVLLVDGKPLFESAIIADYLDETRPPRLHPEDAFERARHRGWVEVASAILNDIAGFYGAPDAATLGARREAMAAKFARVEEALGEGPYFAGAAFSLVDAAFGPVFRYFDVFDTIADFAVFAATPKVRAWRQALAARPSVRAAVAADYPKRLRRFLLARRSELSRRMALAA
ncbi:MAG: glutathione S-transferase family protein [Alphaproteobacteria bacterium]|nr:glutathione S-transferase family protein [Alphaproteobacteria bacterium]MCW5738649.1 glutathione S-transferase family protein [Alphaproteobacteria bacterium]